MDVIFLAMSSWSKGSVGITARISSGRLKLGKGALLESDIGICQFGKEVEKKTNREGKKI